MPGSIDVVTIGNCVLYHGDCRDVLVGIAADVTVTDPPYGVISLSWDSRVHGWADQLQSPADGSTNGRANL